MKGVNWGRIVARVLSVVLVMKTVSLLASTMPNMLLRGELLGQDPGIFDLVTITSIVFIALAILLWFGCDRFSPSSEESSTATRDGITFTTVAVAAIGTYFFLLQGERVLTYGLASVYNESRFPWQASQPALVFHLVSTALSAVLVIKSKALAAWIAK